MAFAAEITAETDDLVARARDKLERKGADLIAANVVGGDVSAGAQGFGGEQGQLTLLARDGEPEMLPLLPKEQAAHLLLDRAAALL